MTCRRSSSSTTMRCRVCWRCCPAPRRASGRRPAGPSPTSLPETRTRSRPSLTTTSSPPSSSSSPMPNSTFARRPPGPSPTPPPAATPSRSSSSSRPGASAPSATSSPSTTPRSSPSPSRVSRTSSRSGTTTSGPPEAQATTPWQPTSPRPRDSRRSKNFSSTPTTTSTRSASRFWRRTSVWRTRRRCRNWLPRWWRGAGSSSLRRPAPWTVRGRHSISRAVREPSLLLGPKAVYPGESKRPDGCTHRLCLCVRLERLISH
mmetsp:Transcript_31174/g.63823  ORF Transcript_31174/g.63823 Transcript_31174/m.63823 type:complete len:261 (-) Transcript_31174:497-1279(-)